MKAVFAAVLLLLGVSPSCFAQSANSDEVKVYGYGGFSCGKWTKVQNHPNTSASAESLAWVEGYVTSAEMYLNGVSYTDKDGILGFMNNYCQAHPTDTIVWAARGLVIELKKP